MKVAPRNFTLPAFLVFVAGVWTGATPAHAGLFSMSESDEIKAGEQVRQQAYKEYGAPLPQWDKRQQRVALLGSMFARQAERKGIPFSYTVLQNDTVLNAFAAPGGPVFVTTKLVATAANDAELAFVLGHETGHIERKHIVRAAEKQQTVGLVAGILGSILSKGDSSSSINAVTNVTFTLWQRGFSRDQESDADSYGVAAMSRLGFDPNAAVSMLGRLGSGSKGLEKYLATHPNPLARQGKVRDQIARDSLTQVARTHGGPLLALESADPSVYRPVYGTNPARPPLPSPPAYAAVGTGSRVVPNYSPSPIPAPVPGPAPGAAGAPFVDFGAPLILADAGDFRVVLAPVAAVAQWAGGSARGNGDGTISVGRGNSGIIYTLNATDATLNGRRVRLPYKVISQQGRVYAPMGSLLSGLGGSASYDETSRSVVFGLPGGPAGRLPLPD